MDNETNIIKTNKDNLNRMFNSKLNILTINKDNNKIELFYSYNQIIGISVNSIVFIDEYFLNFSNTTNKHIKFIKDNYNYIIVNSNDFNKFNDNLVILHDFKYLSNNRIKLLKICLINDLNNFYKIYNKFYNTYIAKLNFYNSNVLNNDISNYIIDLDLKLDNVINKPLKTVFYQIKEYTLIDYNLKFKITKKFKNDKKHSLIKFNIELINNDLNNISDIKCY